MPPAPAASPASPFDWQEYLVLAENLNAIPIDSARRSAISRAYYAVFHKAETVYSGANRLAAQDLGGQSHYKVWQWFRDHHDRSHKSIGENGRRLQKFRERADYNPQFPGLKEQVELQTSNAKRLIDDLNRILSSRQL